MIFPRGRRPLKGINLNATMEQVRKRLLTQSPKPSLILLVVILFKKLPQKIIKNHNR